MTFLAIVSSPLPLSPPSNVVCPLFFVNSAAKSLISCGCHPPPPDGVTRGGRPLMTPLMSLAIAEMAAQCCTSRIFAFDRRGYLMLTRMSPYVIYYRKLDFWATFLLQMLAEISTTVTPFKVSQCHYFRYQSKARIRLPVRISSLHLLNYTLRIQKRSKGRRRLKPRI